MASHAKHRRRLPDERSSLTHKFCLAGHKGYINVGLYPDGTPGEVFIHMSKQGSTINGLLDAWALTASLGLQYGVPLDVFIDKLEHTRFPPSGFTGHAVLGEASSITDYVARWLKLKFVPSENTDEFAAGLPVAQREPRPVSGLVEPRISLPRSNGASDDGEMVPSR